MPGEMKRILIGHLEMPLQDTSTPGKPPGRGTYSDSEFASTRRISPPP